MLTVTFPFSVKFLQPSGTIASKTESQELYLKLVKLVNSGLTHGVYSQNSGYNSMIRPSTVSKPRAEYTKRGLKYVVNAELCN